MIQNGYKKIRLTYLTKINHVFNKQNKDLTKEEKKALNLLKKLENCEFDFEFREIYSQLIICLDKINESFLLLNEIQKVCSIKNFE